VQTASGKIGCFCPVITRGGLMKTKSIVPRQSRGTTGFAGGTDKR